MTISNMKKYQWNQQFYASSEDRTKDWTRSQLNIYALPSSILLHTNQKVKNLVSVKKKVAVAEGVQLCPSLNDSL